MTANLKINFLLLLTLLTQQQYSQHLKFQKKGGPLDECCDVPCVTPAYSCPGGVACPIDCTLTCITGTTTDTPKVYYAVITLFDNVGNRTRYYATLSLGSGCGLTVQEYTDDVQGLCSSFTQADGSAQVVTTADPAEIGDCLGAD